MELPPLKQLPTPASEVHLEEHGAYGVHETLTKGFTSVRSQMCVPHPIEAAVKNSRSNKDQLMLSLLRSTQGMHAPLRLIHERNAVNKVQRLPFLPSSNIALETLEGRDELIDFNDFLNDPMEGVESLAPPHMVMEKHLFS